MGKFTPKKSLKRYTANVLNFLLLFSLIVPNVLSPAIVIAQDLDIEQEESISVIPIDESEDILEEGISTSIFEEGVYTVSLVEEKEYVYPEDDRVRIRFTSITEEGDLTIKKVILTEEEKVSLNTTDEYAWDFTSTMSNGSFTYDLVLPNNQGEEIEVKYSENGSTYSPIDEVLVNEGIVKISGLDHFTTFVVVPAGTIPGDVTEGTEEVDSTCSVSSGSGMFCYDSIQEAIAAAVDGETINVLAGEYEISDTIVINKELTLVGASGAKLININTPAKTIFSITSSNVSIEGFEITHQNSFTQDSNEVARALIAIPDNANLKNIQIKDNLVYGNYPPSTAQKDMYTRGITVGSNGGTDIDITNNTIHSVRNGIVVRPTNTTNTSENTIYNTKGGIMHYTSSSEDADNRTMLDNEWTTAHNEWDIVWNSASYGFPNYQESVIELGELNNDAYILDIRRETPEGAAALEGNRNPVFVTTTGEDKVHQSSGNMNEPFATIQFAIDKVADNGTIYIGDGTFPEIGQIVIDKNLNILGSGSSNTIIKATGDTSSSGDGRGWILITPTSHLNLQSLTLDGLDKKIYQGIRSHGTGLIDNVVFKNMIYGKYLGTGIAFMGNMTIQNSHFENIGRQGMFAFGPTSTDSKIIDNTYIGKGDGDWLDYGIEVGGGAVVEIQGNEISNCTGIASSDNSHSGAILVSTYYGDGSTAKIFENEIYDNYYGVVVGYNSSDTSAVSAYHNNIFDNGYGFRSTAQEVQAQNNWWGHHTGPSGEASGLGDKVSENILYQEWLCEPYSTEWISENGICRLQAPETLGWNVSSLAADPGQTPPALSCGSYTNDNTPSHVWTGIEGENIKYQRQAKTPTGGWWTDPMAYTDTNTPFGWFGNQTNGIEGEWNTRVRAWVDTNENGILDNTDLTSDWSNECKITYDKTAPEKPAGLERRGLDSTIYQCGDIAQLQTLIPDWDDNTEADFSHYEYTSFHPNGSIGINEQKLYSSEFLHNWVPTTEGIYGYAVRAVDLAGNKSPWSLSSKTLEGSCQITYDSTGPVAPSIVFPSEGQYFNSTPILNDWTHSTDPSGIKGYRIKYLTPNGEILRDTISSQRNHKPSISAQGEITIWVQAIDKAGNEGAWSDPVHYYYDKTGPEILFGGLRYINSTTVDTLNINTNDNTPIIFFTASDTLGTVVEASVNGYSATYDGSYWVAEITSPLPEGINSLSIKAKDNAGNESEISHDIFVDTKAPFAQYTYYKDGEKILSSTAYVQKVSQLSFLGQYMDDDPSSGILKDSYVIFDSNLLGTARTSKAYCGWRGTGNTVMIPYTEKVLFTNCEPTLPDGQYFMYHQVYDTAVRKDIPTITQFRDVKGLHFVVDTIAPVVEITSSLENDSLSGEVIIQGNVKDLNLSHYNISIYDGDADVNDFSKRLLQNTEYTTEFDTKNLLTWDTTEFDNGEYQIRLEARDLAGNRDDDTSIQVIKVLVDNTSPTTEQPTQNEQEVLGANTTTNSPTLAKKVTTYIADILGVGGEGDVLALEEDEETLEDEEEVKGSQTCDNPSTISGYIYIDSNENGEKDEKERVFPEISIRIYTITEGMEETVKQIVSDENGYWETTLCSGDYSISVDDSKLPNNYVLEEDTLGVQVEEDKDSTLNFNVLDERNFLQKYWPWILLAVGILGSIGIVAVDTRRKKEYI